MEIYKNGVVRWGERSLHMADGWRRIQPAKDGRYWVRLAGGRISCAYDQVTVAAANHQEAAWVAAKICRIELGLFDVSVAGGGLVWHVVAGQFSNN